MDKPSHSSSQKLRLASHGLQSTKTHETLSNHSLNSRAEPTSQAKGRLQSASTHSVVPDMKLLRAQPTHLVCPACSNSIMTKVQRRPGLKSILMCCLSSIFTSCLCLCWVPCCHNRCTDALHTCPDCAEEIGIWERRIRI